MGHIYTDSFTDASSYVSKNEQNAPDNELDDYALWGGALTAAEVASKVSISLTDNLAAEPDLVLFYNFNDPLNNVGYAKNLGTAGSDYDLIFGQYPKPTGFEYFGQYFKHAGTGAHHRILKPTRVPSSDSSAWTVPKALDTSAPVVVTAAAGETITINKYGVATSYTAPAIFTSTASFVSGTKTVHVVPRLAPTPNPLDVFRHFTANEDTSTVIPLDGSSDVGSGFAITATITALPAKGSLYALPSRAKSNNPLAADKISAVGTVVQNPRAVQYVPDLHGFGSPYDTFAYALTVEGVTSAATTVTLNLSPDNDLPETSAPSTIQLLEDRHTEGVLVTLAATDAETGTPLNYLISSLPTKGTLYLTDDGTLNGTRSKITEPYSRFRIGEVFSQYVSDVKAVSSHWGTAPPSADYHPILLIGPPDCKEYGECAQDAAWTLDNTLYPPVGIHVYHSSLLAYVRAVDTAAGQVTLEYAKMYKYDGATLRQCHFGTPGKSAYPIDCSFDAVPASGLVSVTVDRMEISAIGAGVWCPLKKFYTGDMHFSFSNAKDLAFGAQYAINHNMIDHYPLGGYTEYIEVSIATPVYLVQLEVGMPRGMGAIVNIKAKEAGRGWISLYKEPALLSETAKYAKTKSYWTWDPNACRTHSLVADFRIEMDTSKETGIPDWNYMDYFRVFGSTTLQEAAVRTDVSKVVYVPDIDATGVDSFTYQATDCPGDDFRRSAATTVTFFSSAVNDAPVGTHTELPLSVDVASYVTLPVVDVDNANLTFTIRRLPLTAMLNVPDDPSAALNTSLPAGTALQVGSVLTSPKLAALSATCGPDSLIFTASDGQYETPPINFTLVFTCPRECDYTDMTEYVGECDSSTVKFKLGWSWNSGSDCDLSRASGLISENNVECDYIDYDYPHAGALYALMAICLVVKFCLLGYVIKYRDEAVFRNAQPLFVGITIVGAMVADISPFLLLGEVETWRCHAFPSLVLLATTLLYGPLVLKTYRVWKIFVNPTLKMVRVSTLKLMSQLAAVLLIDLIFIIVTAAVHPVSAEDYSYKYTEAEGGQYVMRRRCEDNGHVFLLGAMVLGSVPIVVAIYLAYQTRNVKADFTENQPILVSLYTLTIAGIVLLPLTFVLGENYMVMTFFINSIGILLVSLVSILAFVGPKIFVHKFPQVAPNPVGTAIGDTSATMVHNKTMASDMDMDAAEIEKEMEELQYTIMQLKLENSRLASASHRTAASAEEDRGDAAAAEPDHAAAEPDQLALERGGAAARSNAAEVRSDAAEAQSDAAEAQSDGAEAQSDGAKARSDGAEAHSDGAKARSDGAEARSDSAEALHRLADELEGSENRTPSKGDEDVVKRLSTLMGSPANPVVNDVESAASEEMDGQRTRSDPNL